MVSLSQSPFASGVSPRRGFARGAGPVLALAFALSFAGRAGAAPVPENEIIDRREATPPQLQGVDVQERLGQKVPFDLRFRDQNGHETTLGSVFDGKHPVLLTLNYSNCPMLCSLMLNGLVKGLTGVEWSLNKDYRAVTVSLEPNEPVDVASRTLDRYLKQYGRADARGGWSFFAGSDENVHAFARSIGFSYRYDQPSKQFAHPAAVVLAAPDGTISRYLYGLEYEPKTLRLGLVEASEGRLGTTLDRVVLYCFHYDATAGHYAPVAQRLMKLGGALGLGLIVAFVWVLHRTDVKRRRRLADSTAP